MLAHTLLETYFIGLYTFPTVAKYSPSGDHLAMCTDAAVLRNSSKQKKTIIRFFYSLLKYLRGSCHVSLFLLCSDILKFQMLTSSSCFTRRVCACVSVHNKFNSFLWWHSRKHTKRGRKTVTRHLLFTRKSKNKSDELTSLTNRKWRGEKHEPS